MIPKTIHQTWKTNSPFKIFTKIMEHNKGLNKDYEFKLWHQEDGEYNVEAFLKKEYEDIWQIYEKCKFGVQKADIIRLVLIYHYGGVYIDMDMLCLKSLDDLIDFGDNNFYVSMEPREQTKKLYNDENVICNAFLAAPAKHPVLNQALEQIRKIHRVHGDAIFAVFNVFGGDLLAKAVLVENSKDCKFVNRKLVYPINDPKFDDLTCSADDAIMLRKGTYDKAYLVHYWIHSNFESRDLLEKFDYDDKESIHHNVYTFFKKLYTDNRHLQ